MTESVLREADIQLTSAMVSASRPLAVLAEMAGQSARLLKNLRAGAKNVTPAMALEKFNIRS